MIYRPLLIFCYVNILFKYTLLKDSKSFYGALFTLVMKYGSAWLHT